MSGPRIRSAVRALVLDPADRVLLVRFAFPDRVVWAAPGGGIEVGESDEDAIRRELLEEAGLERFELGPAVWTREHRLSFGRWDGQAERFYLVRAPAFEPEPRLSRAELQVENVTGLRWWTLVDIETSGALFAPRRLAGLLRTLLEEGPPAEPVDVGV